MIEEDGKLKDIHEKYKAFKKTDSISFIRIFIGVNTLLWARSTLIFISLVTMYVYLKIASYFKNQKITKIGIRFFSSIILIFFGLIIKKRRKNCDQLYKQYFGEEYNISYDNGHSIIISNHTGWVDILIHLNTFACGFIANEGLQNCSVPMISVISKQIGCLFLKREDTKNRQEILKQIEQRQIEFMNGTTRNTIVLFPEGTCTSGKFLLNLKKGAFYSLMPIKPAVININENNSFNLSLCTGYTFTHLLLTVCYLYHNVTVMDLPVMFPNDFMFENYSKNHPEIKDKWEIFSGVARDIIAHSGNLIKSELTYRDSKTYYDLLENFDRKNI